MSATHPRKVHRHLIFVEEPHQCSYANLVSLNKYLYMQTDDCLLRWIKHRKAYLRKHLRKDNTLRCEYCGKTGLRINTKKLPLLATIDHKIPLSKTRNKHDEKNFVIACYTCNSAKGVMSEREFRQNKYCQSVKNNWAVKNVLKLFSKYCFCSLKICLTFKRFVVVLSERKSYGNN